MKERLLEFLRNENKTSAQLAEDIGVQASGISHILSGRNNPSLDFILKMLEKYQYISTDWLLFGKGSMYKEAKMQNLFDYDTVKQMETNVSELSKDKLNKTIDYQDVMNKPLEKGSAHNQKTEFSSIVRIVWFFENNSFEEFFPRK